MIELLFPTNDLEISILTPVQREFLLNQKKGVHNCPVCYDGQAHDGQGPYTWLFDKYGQNFNWTHVINPNEMTLSAPYYIKFSWKADIPCHIEISRACDFGKPQEEYPGSPLPFEVDYIYENEGIVTACLGNFLMDTRYFWRVVAKDGSQVSETRSFQTLDEFPRFIYAQGTANVRDLGGAKTYDGKRILQGRIYRGGALEPGAEYQYALTPRGKKALCDGLKICSQVDLRSESVGKLTESSLGKEVDFRIFPVYGYDAFFAEEMRDNVRHLIEFLADENNYPIYLHCHAGADRTGTVVYILQVLLQVKAEYIPLDYNITSLTLLDIRCREDITFYRGDLLFDEEKKLGDKEMAKLASERIEEFLIKSCKVPAEVIQRLRKNLLGE